MILIVVICYREGYKANSAKGKMHAAKSGGARHRLPEPSLGGVMRDTPSSSAMTCDLMCECLPPRKLS